MAVSTRDRLIEAGNDLFYRDGFHAVGLDRIIAAVGTTKTTFYNHFESKEDLALAVVRMRDARWRTRFPELLRERAGEDPVGRLREVFGVWRDWFNNVHFQGCIFIHACSEFPDPRDPVHQAAKANADALCQHVRDLAAAAGAEDPAGFAEQFKIIMQGSIVVEVIDRRNEAASTAARLADALIERELPLAAD